MSKHRPQLLAVRWKVVRCDALKSLRAGVAPVQHEQWQNPSVQRPLGRLGHAARFRVQDIIELATGITVSCGIIVASW